MAKETKKRSKRRYKQRTASKHGNDRNHLARLLQERTAKLKALRKKQSVLLMKLKNVAEAVGQGSKLQEVKALVGSILGGKA